MATSRTLKLNLLADVSNFVKELGGVQTKLEGFQKGLKQASKVASVALVGLAAAGKTAIDAASDLNESLSKSVVIFGDSSDAIKAWSKTTSKALGLSQTAALEAASNFALLGQSAGLTGVDLSNFSTDLTGLAADLASFNNTTVDEAITALAAGLRGESEPLRKFGVLLSANAVEAKAMELNLADTTKALTDQDKVLARNALIMEQTTLQQGDFARTAGGAANQQRILTATVLDAQAQLGEGLLPVYEKFLTLAVGLATALGENAEMVVQFAIALTGLALTIKAVTIAQLLWNIAVSANPIGLLILAIGAAATAFLIYKASVNDAADATTNFNMQARDTARSSGRNKKAVQTLDQSLQGLLSTLPKVAKGLSKAQQALEDAKAAFNSYRDSVESAITTQFTFSNAFETKGPGSFLESLRRQAAAAKDFGAKLAQLVAMGLNRGALTQIINAGALVGTQIADELIAGGTGAVGETNALVADVSNFANTASGSIASGVIGNGGDNYNITINGAVDPEGVRRSLERLFQASARRTGAINLVGATL